MPFTKIPNQNFKIENNHIVLNEQFLNQQKNKFKKITGSRLASILGFNKYCSPVKVWAMMVGIYSEPMDETVALVGNVIEPKIRDFVAKKLNQNFVSYEPQKIKWDLFSENTIFGGIPDGEPINSDGSLAYDKGAPMLEIKTTSIDSFVYQTINNQLVLIKDKNGVPLIKTPEGKRNSWFDQNNNIVVPIEYQFQLGLYCYLRKIQNGVFAIAFLKPDDYVNPYKTKINEREIQLVDFHINLQEFEFWIQKAKVWYEKYILGGISPELTLDDLQWYKQEVINYESKNNLS